MRLLIFLLLIIPPVSGFAQSHSPQNGAETKSPQHAIASQFEHLSVKDGLSNNSVTCILQDREGFLWFGTQDGLNKYDGNTFTVLQQDPDNPDSSLHSNNISALYEDRSGKLWVTTLRGTFAGGEGGLHQIDKRTGIVTPIRINVPSEKWKQTLSIYEDRQNVLWVGSLAGLIRYEPQTGRYTLYPSPQQDIPVICSIEDTQHRFWVGTLNGLYLFDRQSGRFTLVPLLPASVGHQPWISTLHQDKAGNLWAGTNSNGLLKISPASKPGGLVPYVASGSINAHIFMNAIHEDPNGQLWLGTTEGLQQIDTRTDKVFTYRTNTALNSALSSNRVQTVYRDRAGTLWIGTDQGIDKQIGPSATFTTIQLVSAPPSMPPAENNISALIQDRGGMIWIGSDNKKLFRYHPEHRQMTFMPIDPISPKNPSEPNKVQAIYEDRAGQLWVSTVDALLRMDHATGTFVRHPTRIHRIQSIVEDKSGLLWLSGKGGIARYNPKSSQFQYYFYNPSDTTDGQGFVECVMVSRTGDVWMAINGKGVSRLHPATGKFTHYHPTLPAPAGQLTDRQVQALYEDTDGVVWIGTNKGGLNRYDPATGRFTTLTTRDGLPANHVSAIINDRHGYLWISTSRGICRFNTKTKTFHNYTTADGLPHNGFMSKVSYGINGDLLFGSLNGVAIVHTDRIYNTATFPVYITRFGVLDRTRPLTGNRIELRHDENFISFDFVALSYRSPEKNQYAYQLIGADKNWVYSGTRHFASYSTLSPGSYTFRVKAANSDGFWTQQVASVQVIVHPPWWATWWAYGLYALLLGGAIWGYIRFYTNRIRQQQESDLNRREAEQLKSVDELKTRFFSNITHEFRTPLSLIIGPVEKMIQQSRFDRSTLTMVLRNADQLLRLINQLLDLSKLEGNYMTVSLVQGEVTDFVNHIVELFQQSAEQKKVALQCIVADFPRQEYVFDADKWEKILTNLLSNALKFTPAGGQVTLMVRPLLVDGEVTAMQLQLVDTGIGIAPEKLSHIFDRFYQADTSSTRLYEGTGIGLALVHELIGLLGGSITVESQVGAGTTFRLTLPVRSASTTAEAPALSWLTPPARDIAEPRPSPDLMPHNPQPVIDQALPRILVVEDNDELREFLVGELAPVYQILQAADGEEGWQITQTELPDIVLTDVMMPRKDGYELTRLIKENPQTDHIAVVILSARAAQQSRIDGLQQGADDYLSKPFSVDELRLRIHNLITRQQKVAAHYRQQFALPQPTLQPAPPVAPDPFLLRIYSVLDERLDDPDISVDWLASQLDMNRKTLYRKVNSLIQLSPTELIQQYRLRRAADMLGTGRSVAETADLVGFRSASYFSSVFKDFYQQTPTEFMTNRNKGA